ncbi:dynein axonemal assembly factor 6 [Culex pipiens pallens]|uniref:dynein axonemal assembly factor 6 n=1 Tax=Culex pipiens pallens TaxID=42434 RepID=UPI0019536B61|nr:dynein axonemal assembly factor 6 [Culex pipiens pallens]
MLSVDNIKQLKKLFRPEDGSDSEDDGHDGGVGQLGPGDIGGSSQRAKEKAPEHPDEHVKPCSYAPLEKKPEPELPKSVEEWERLQEVECENLLESRPRPEYKITYKQTVATEDLYLQMSGKTASTSSCESMVVEVFLTGETVGIQHIDLTVQEQGIKVRSPKYFLDLHLPHKIDPDRGNAAWLSEEKILKLTLKLVREFDFVNF